MKQAQTLSEEKPVSAPSTRLRPLKVTRDGERIERIQHALKKAGWDALVCARPSNVLLLSGYWPVIGTAIAIATRAGKIGLIVPEDERELAVNAGADELETFSGGSLDELTTPAQEVRPALARLGRKFKIKQTTGFEHDPAFEPTSYAGVHSYSGALREILAESIPVSFVPADDLLGRLRATLTAREMERVRIACAIAQTAYSVGAAQLRPGLTETEAAALFRIPLSASPVDSHEPERADGFTYCMSGPNSAEAFAAYQLSRSRRINPGDLALVHCNSWVDGYWTDVTRTFCCGEPDERALKIYEAVFAARRAALEVIQPGIPASRVDRAAREVMADYGFAQAFKHPTGHGVGFSAINHLAKPCLHPASHDALETGMVFNVEPGVYLPGYGGVRHCDMVVVTERAAEVLTPFQVEVADLILTSRS